MEQDRGDVRLRNLTAAACLLLLLSSSRRRRRFLHALKSQVHHPKHTAHTRIHTPTPQPRAGTFTKNLARGSCSSWIIKQDPPTQKQATHHLTFSPSSFFPPRLASSVYSKLHPPHHSSPLKMLHQGLRRAAHVALTTQTTKPILAARSYTSTAFLSRPFSSQGANLQKVIEGREGREEERACLRIERGKLRLISLLPWQRRVWWGMF